METVKSLLVLVLIAVILFAAWFGYKWYEQKKACDANPLCHDFDWQDYIKK